MTDTNAAKPQSQHCEPTVSDFDQALARPLKVRSDKPFLAALIVLGGAYVAVIVLMILANIVYTDQQSFLAALNSKEIRFSIKLSLLSCNISTLLSLWVSVPIGYLMSRFQFRGKSFIEAVLDIPIVLPPLVIGVSLLILFNFPPLSWFSSIVVFEVPAVIIAQFTVAAAFASRTMRVTFDQIPSRFEDVAMTLGCNRKQAFWQVILPQAKHGLLAAGTLAWARSLGEFGPILVFAGSTRLRTEVLSTSVYLELQTGNLKGMLAISIIMVATAAVVLIIARLFGMQRLNA
ncbi:MAG: Sulfate transport system permease protein CysW [Verrucomicrobia subdivision 3 bacterium]|nr:Sulfate transport system permease protein CysW [Limisphaerales bacterium]MCS1416172.1 Sulfate transport system permease protein CysW [Limisphaerales bacterium]